MTADTLDIVLAEALALSEDSRLKLVEQLIPTIHSDAALEQEQLQVVRRRINEVRSGKVTPIPGEQVFREIEASLAARRPA